MNVRRGNHGEQDLGGWPAAPRTRAVLSDPGSRGRGRPGVRGCWRGLIAVPIGARPRQAAPATKARPEQRPLHPRAFCRGRHSTRTRPHVDASAGMLVVARAVAPRRLVHRIVGRRRCAKPGPAAGQRKTTGLLLSESGSPNARCGAGPSAVTAASPPRTAPGRRPLGGVRCCRPVQC